MQDEVNQDYSEQNEVDGMKKGADRIDNTAIRTYNFCGKMSQHKVWPRLTASAGHFPASYNLHLRAVQYSS